MQCMPSSGAADAGAAYLQAQVSDDMEPHPHGPHGGWADLAGYDPGDSEDGGAAGELQLAEGARRAARISSPPALGPRCLPSQHSQHVKRAGWRRLAPAGAQHAKQRPTSKMASTVASAAPAPVETLTPSNVAPVMAAAAALHAHMSAEPQTMMGLRPVRSMRRKERAAPTTWARPTTRPVHMWAGSAGQERAGIWMADQAQSKARR